MKRRTRLALSLWALLSVWLWVQSPFAHAARQAAPAAHSEQLQSEPPCHGAHDATQPADPLPADRADCCADGHCNGQCAHLTWAPLQPQWLFTPTSRWSAARTEVAGLERARLPELFRPPI